MSNIDRVTAQHLAGLDATARNNWYDQNFDKEGHYVPYLPANADVWAIREKTINPVVYAVNELRRKFKGFIGLGNKNVVDCRSFTFEGVAPNTQYFIRTPIGEKETPVRAILEEAWGNDKILTPVSGLHYNREEGFVSIRTGQQSKGRILIEFWQED